ncbi:MAG: extracellular solute-binding protein [Treponema sp.]|jgi:putative aldouronate transport system substrate-binding protein|nr:extracellular solute-binding protein [Treponema sp.]
MKRVFAGMLTLCLTAASAFAGGGSAARSSGETVNGLDPVTLSFIFFDSKKSATDEVWNAIAEEFKNELNAKFDVSFIAGSDYADKMLVKFSAGDVWDLNFDGDWLQYYRTVAMNGYMALDELLPKYAPDLYKAYQSSGALDAAKVNGKVVALPWTNIMTNRTFFQWRSDLLDVNPATVKTVEDVEKVLYELKRRYPDRYTIENASMEMFQTKNDLIAGTHNFVFNPKDRRVQVQYIAETQAFRERAAYAEKWQKDGLIWADVLVDQLDHNQLINQGRLITKWGTHEFATDTRAWVEPSAKWGFSSLYDDKAFPLRTPLSNIVAIPRTSKNPERTLMWMNLMETSQKMFDLVMYGIEGKTYVKDASKPNTVKYPAGMNDNNSNYMNWQGRWALFKPQFMRGDPLYREGFWQEEKDFALGNPNNIASPLAGFSLKTDSITNELAQIQAVYDAANKMLDVGLAGPSGAAIDKLIADLNRAGLPKVKAEYQRQVDAFLASK